MRWFAAASGFAGWAKTTPANAATRPAGIWNQSSRAAGPALVQPRTRRTTVPVTMSCRAVRWSVSGMVR